MLEGRVLVPTFSIAWCSMPGRSVSTRNMVIPIVRFSTSSRFFVRAITSIFLAWGTAVIQIFWPLRRHPFPSGAVKAMQQLNSPRIRPGRRSRFCCSVPNRDRVIPPKIGLIMKSCPRVDPPPLADRASMTMVMSSIPRPAPPYSSGRAIPQNPASQMACQISFGNCFLPSSSRQYSRPNLLPIWRAVSTINTCSSFIAKFIGSPLHSGRYQELDWIFKIVDDPVEDLEAGDPVEDPVVAGEHEADLLAQLRLAGAAGAEKLPYAADAEDRRMARADDRRQVGDVEHPGVGDGDRARRHVVRSESPLPGLPDQCLGPRDHIVQDRPSRLPEDGDEQAAFRMHRDADIRALEGDEVAFGPDTVRPWA